jgi:hypothetical protein
VANSFDKLEEREKKKSQSLKKNGGYLESSRTSSELGGRRL